MLKPIHFLFAIIAFLSLSVQAQIQEGAIRYEMRMDLHRNIPPEREDMKRMIPQYRTEQFELLFNNTGSLYKPLETDDDLVMSRGGARMTIRMPRTETYINKENRERAVMMDFMGRTYLITDTLKIDPWKIGNEQMEIAGYMCMMAYYTDTILNQEITAWFTPHIQPFAGPDRFVTLPGTVLALDINNGERVWVARKIEAREIKRGEIRKPTRGEKISREEFNKMIEEQMRQMNPGGGGNMRMFGF